MSPISKWLPLYRALKLNGYNAELRPIISGLLRDSEAKESVLLDTLAKYYEAEAEHQDILREFYPGTVLEGQEMLKKVANVVGLELPKLKN